MEGIEFSSIDSRGIDGIEISGSTELDGSDGDNSTPALLLALRRQDQVK
jgi:hypothetical protein